MFRGSKRSQLQALSSSLKRSRENDERCFCVAWGVSTPLKKKKYILYIIFPLYVIGIINHLGLIILSIHLGLSITWDYYRNILLCSSHLGLFYSQLVGGFSKKTLWKIYEWKSVGMIRNPIYGKTKNGNQTTDRPTYWYFLANRQPGLNMFE